VVFLFYPRHSQINLTETPILLYNFTIYQNIYQVVEQPLTVLS